MTQLAAVILMTRGFFRMDNGLQVADGGRVTATELRAILDEAGVMPSRKLGQNFLIEQNTARCIVEQLDVQPGDTVVEVGPGTGALTEFVVGTVKKVVLVEYD